MEQCSTGHCKGIVSRMSGKRLNGDMNALEGLLGLLARVVHALIGERMDDGRRIAATCGFARLRSPV
jgi:hypothetical protein